MSQLPQLPRALVPHEPQPGQVALRWLGQGGFALRSPDAPGR